MATEEPYYPPDFSMTTLDGAPMRLSDLRGRWVVINFWATWCEPCIREIPTLGRIADEYADTLTILGVNMREERAQVTAFVRDLGVRYPILVNPDDDVGDIYRRRAAANADHRAGRRIGVAQFWGGGV